MYPSREAYLRAIAHTTMMSLLMRKFEEHLITREIMRNVDTEYEFLCVVGGER